MQIPSTIVAIKEALRKGEWTSVALVEAYFERIEQYDETINAFITHDKAKALEQARIADERGYDDDSPVLNGVPIGIKDNIVMQDMPTTAASRMLEDFVPTYDATVVRKLKGAGAVILGKLNMDEFAMGGSNETSYFGIVRNPWNTERTPGGSSGGSAAAVAAQMVPASLGTDTGGSIRQPAAYNNLVGVKPTYGSISRYGAIAFGSSLDQVGPLTHTVEDAAIMLGVLAGHDPNDMMTRPDQDNNYQSKLNQSIEGLRIAIPKEFNSEVIQPAVKEHVALAVEYFQSQGAIVEEVEMPNLKYGVNAYYILSSAEASSNLSRYDGIRYGYRSESAKTLDEVYVQSRSEGFGEEVKRRIMLGTYSLLEDNYELFFEKAARIRTLIIQDFKNVFEQYDLIVGPVTINTAFPLGTQVEDVIEMYTADLLTVPASLAGLPAISIPAGFDDDKMPIGLQLIGKPLDEATLFQVAHHFEQNHDYAHQRASL